MKFNEWIKVKRKTLGLSQVGLAKMLGVDRKTVVRWEHGDFIPDLNNINKISIKLGISWSDIAKMIEG